jgi:hypothetical protein
MNQSSTHASSTTTTTTTTYRLALSALSAVAFLTYCSIDDTNREYGPEDQTGQGGDSSSSPNSGGEAGQRSTGSAGDGGTSSGEAGAAGEGGIASGRGGEGGSVEPPVATGGGPTCTSRCAEIGDECSSPDDCESGRCVDGVCCESSCSGACEACSAELTGAASGVCAAVSRDTDPDDDCEDEGAASCGQTGMCDGDGACAIYGATTVCGAATCSSGMAESERRCDGEGACEAAERTACAPFLCGEEECRTECQKDSDCASGSFCVVGVCGPRAQLLEACEQDIDCARGECFGRLCGLAVESIGLEGDEVPGGGGQIFVRGWYESDENGRNRQLVGEFSSDFRLYFSLDMNTQMDSPQPPGTYFLLTGEEGSDPLTRTFQFNLSDGTSVTKEVQASRSDNMLLHPDAVVGGGDPFVLFEFTGADVNVLRKEY